MCNEAYRRSQIGDIVQDWGQTRIPLVFPEGMPNTGEQPSIRITDRAPIIRAGEGAPQLVVRRWSWPGAGGRPVYNFRSDGRQLDDGRCLIPVNGFFEFTDAPADERPTGKRAPKAKWAFELVGHDWFCIAGVWRTDREVGEAWTMLTCPPGPDIAPYHTRQVVVLGRDDWGRWLDPTVAAATLCQPLPQGSLAVARVR